METTGKIISYNQDYTGTVTVTLQFIDKSDELYKLNDADVDIRIVKHRNKRSLDANAYCWQLCTKIAEVLNSSKDEIYSQMIDRYAPIYEDESGFIVMTVKSEVDMSKITGHWKYYKSSADGKFRSYLMLKGSSEMNSKEMSVLIDGIVSEAKELDIQTATPDEIAKMKAEYGVQL